MQTTGGEEVSGGLEGDGWGAKGEGEEGGERAAEGVACEPDLGVRVECCDVVVQVLRAPGR